MDSETERLKKELKILQEKRQTETDVNKLKKQIRGERFAQTSHGKVFNAIGDFGLGVTKKVLTQPPKQKGNKKKRKSMKEMIDFLPQ